LDVKLKNTQTPQVEEIKNVNTLSAVNSNQKDKAYDLERNQVQCFKFKPLQQPEIAQTVIKQYDRKTEQNIAKYRQWYRYL
jgi:secreted Zn-dependent insulinase-like peptidase